MSAGVYVLTHAGRGFVYVGASVDLERREASFRWALTCLYISENLLLRHRVGFVDWPRMFGRLPSSRFGMAARGTLPHEWRFTVLEILPPEVDEALAEKAEYCYIRSAKALFGQKCLNVYTVPDWARPAGRHVVVLHKGQKVAVERDECRPVGRSRFTRGTAARPVSYNPQRS